MSEEVKKIESIAQADEIGRRIAKEAQTFLAAQAKKQAEAKPSHPPVSLVDQFDRDHTPKLTEEVKPSGRRPRSKH